MGNRFFLLALVGALILLQAALRTAAQATPFSSAETLGGITFWELRGALPLGIFALGMLLMSTAAMCLCLQSALCISGSQNRLRKQARAIASASLWCGIPLVAMCMASLHYVFPWLSAYAPDGWQTLQHLEWVIHGSLVTLLLCHALPLCDKRTFAYISLPLSLCCLIAQGQMCFRSPLILIPIAIMSAAGMLMIPGRGRKWAFIPLMTAIGMNAALFQLTSPQESATPAAWAVYLICLLLIMVPFTLKLKDILCRC